MTNILNSAFRYQIGAVLIMSFAGFTNALVTYWPTFAQFTPPFRCRSELDENPKFSNFTFEEMHDFIATNETRNIGNQFGFNQCKMINFTEAFTKCGSEFSTCSNISEVLCDEFIYDYGFLSNRSSLTTPSWSSVVGQLNLV